MFPCASGNPNDPPVPIAGPPTRTFGNRVLIASACDTNDLCAASGVPSQYLAPYTNGAPPQFSTHPSYDVISPVPVDRHCSWLYSGVRE